MRAAVCRAFGEPLAIEEVELAAPGANDVLVRVEACAVCHSDIHYAEGAWGGALPAVYGHEAAGIVEAVGPGVATVGPGDRVIVTLIRYCGSCWFCASGQPTLCNGDFEQRVKVTTADGTPVFAAMHTGAFAERVLVHSSQAIPIGTDIPFEAASLLACGVLTGVGAVINTAQVRVGESVVVIGTGGVGLNAVQGAAVAGAEPIVAVDLSEEKLAAARGFGATHVVNPREQDAEAAVAELTDGRKADHVFVTVGAKPAIEQALGLVRRGGTVVVVGMTATGVTTEYDPTWLANGSQRIVGSKMGDARPALDIPRLVALYRDGRLKLDELISGRYPLEQINEAIASVNRGEALRNVVVMR
jgi:Zn-dependent alcohol dehydrogenase